MPVKTKTDVFRRLRRLAILVCAAITVAACSNSLKKVSVPSHSAASPAPPTVSAEDAVAKAYIDSAAISRQANIAPADRIRPILQQAFAPGDYFEFLVRQALALQKLGQIPWGAVVDHLTKVTVNGTTATVEDCEDDSNAGMADKATGQLIPSTRGSSHQTSVAKLVLGADQRWLVSEIRGYDRLCTRPS